MATRRLTRAAAAVGRLVATLVLLLGAPSAVRGRSSPKTRLVLFYTGWCGELCDEPLEAIKTLQTEIKDNRAGDRLEAIAVDCSSAWHAPTCCRHGVKSYPTVHVTPAGSDKFWVFQGERVYDQMRFALFDDTSPKALVAEQEASILRCAIKAVKLKSTHFLTRTMAGSAILGCAIGGSIVYTFVSMRQIKFGAQKSDFAAVAGTALFVYLFFT